MSKMSIAIEQVNGKMHFEGVSQDGKHKVQIDSSPDFGGEDKGFRPMELLLVSIAACSSMDVVILLEKMRQNLQGLRVEVEGERYEDRVPGIFRSIVVKYILKGDVKEDKAHAAIEKSLQKYCSVSMMIDRKETNIDYICEFTL